MLAKLWKKILLAVCILACLFNIMSKIVNRTSLDINLKSVKDGESIGSIFEDENKDNTTINNVANEENASQSVENALEDDTAKTETSVEEDKKENDSKTVKATDFTIIY